MTRFSASLIAALLCSTILAGSANAGILGDLFSSSKSTQAGKAEPAAKTDSTADAAKADAAPPMDLEAGVGQAQAQRQARHYDEAIRTLSQLMLVASDDARVVGEYGKTLAEKGRAQDAVQFLTRATQLQPTDWSLYSALGVAYDQVGDQSSARMAYEHALQINPTEPSILNNYALSRMLANDPDTARQLIARAEAAGGSSDAKIARNIELVNRLAPTAQPAPAPASAPDKVAAEPPVTVSTPVAVNSAPLPPTAADKKEAPKVVMQAVPADSHAGKPATHEPTPLGTQVATQKADAPKAEAKPEAKAAKSEAAKAEPVKAEAAKPAIAVAAAKPEVKPEAKPAKVELRTDTKPQPKPASKAIPALRQTASVY
jgi:Flp pilus assembly protein TadD